MSSVFADILKRPFWQSLFTGGATSGRTKYTFEELRALYDVLAKNQVVTEANRAVVVETIRSIAEFMIWGDQNEPRIFDFFLENNIMHYLHRVLQQPTNRSGDVAKQVLQTLSIIIQNIRSETGTYFLFSNNHINNIVEIRFDFEDEEVLGYYISFLKTISLKLNSRTVQFFFDSREAECTFPLYSEAVKFAHHKEGMVRAGVRTLTLNVYSVADASIQSYVCRPPATSYFAEMATYIADQVKILDKRMTAAEGFSPTVLSSLDSQLAEVEDMVSYVADILATAHPRVAHLVSQQLWLTLVGPHILRPILEYGNRATGAGGPGTRSSLGGAPSSPSAAPSGGAAAHAPGAAPVRPACALYVLERLFVLLAYPPLLHNLALALLDPRPGHPSCRTALGVVLRSADQRAVPAALRCLVALLHNRHVTPELLALLGVLPRHRTADARAACAAAQCGACHLRGTLPPLPQGCLAPGSAPDAGAAEATPVAALVVVAGGGQGAGAASGGVAFGYHVEWTRLEEAAGEGVQGAAAALAQERQEAREREAAEAAAAEAAAAEAEAELRASGSLGAAAATAAAAAAGGAGAGGGGGRGPGPLGEATEGDSLGDDDDDAADAGPSPRSLYQAAAMRGGSGSGGGTADALFAAPRGLEGATSGAEPAGGPAAHQEFSLGELLDLHDDGGTSGGGSGHLGYGSAQPGCGGPLGAPAPPAGAPAAATAPAASTPGDLLDLGDLLAPIATTTTTTTKTPAATADTAGPALPPATAHGSGPPASPTAHAAATAPAAAPAVGEPVDLLGFDLEPAPPPGGPLAAPTPVPPEPAPLASQLAAAGPTAQPATGAIPAGDRTASLAPAAASASPVAAAAAGGTGSPASASGRRGGAAGGAHSGQGGVHSPHSGPLAELLDMLPHAAAAARAAAATALASTSALIDPLSHAAEDAVAAVGAATHVMDDALEATEEAAAAMVHVRIGSLHRSGASATSAAAGAGAGAGGPHSATSSSALGSAGGSHPSPSAATNATNASSSAAGGPSGDRSREPSLQEAAPGAPGAAAAAPAPPPAAPAAAAVAAAPPAPPPPPPPAGPPCAHHARPAAVAACSTDLLDALFDLLAVQSLAVPGLWNAGLLLNALTPRVEEQRQLEEAVAAAAAGPAVAQEPGDLLADLLGVGDDPLLGAPVATTAATAAAAPAAAAAAAATAAEPSAKGAAGGGAPAPSHPLGPSHAAASAEGWACILTAPQQEALRVACVSAFSSILDEVGGMWADALAAMMVLEWPLAADALSRPSLRTGSETLMAGPHLYPRQPAGGRGFPPGSHTRNDQGLSGSAVAALHSYHAVCRAVALLHVTSLLRRGDTERRAPPDCPPLPGEEVEGREWDVVEGQEVELQAGSAIPCIVSFAPGQERRVYFAAAGPALRRLADYVHDPAALLADAAARAAVLHSSPAVVLADPAPTRLNAGISLSVSPLLGSEPAVDRTVPKWLHVHVRPSVRGLLRLLRGAAAGRKGGLLGALRHLVDGHWVLAFPDAERAANARQLVEQAAHKLRALYCELLSPLLGALTE